MLNVSVGGPLRDYQDDRDLAVGLSLCDERRNFALPGVGRSTALPTAGFAVFALKVIVSPAARASSMARSRVIARPSAQAAAKAASPRPTRAVAMHRLRSDRSS